MGCCRFKEKKKTSCCTRIVQVDTARDAGHQVDKRTAVKHCDNKICTSRYTVCSFIPRNLYEQFSKFSNFYFLFIFVLQSISGISVTNGIPTIGLPLSFVITVNAIKDALEDRKRHQSDKEENLQTVTILSLHPNTKQLPSAALDQRFTLTQRGPDDPKGFKRQKSAVALTRQERKLLEEDALQRHNESSPQPKANLGSGLLERIPESTETDTEMDTDTDTYDDQSTTSDGSDFDSPESLRLRKHLQRLKWKDLKVGQVVCIFQDQIVPADVILLASSDARGKVFIETSSLDGETNLKVKHCLQEFVDAVNLAEGVPGNVYETTAQESRLLTAATLDCLFECSPPDPDLRAFSGSAVLRQGYLKPGVWESILHSYQKRSGASGEIDKSVEQVLLPLSSNQLMLRGCKLCHTSWAVGVVAFTGAETKIRLNSEAVKRKCSKLEKQTHRLVMGIFGLMILLCILAGCMTAYFATHKRYVNLKYLALEKYKPYFSYDKTHKEGEALAHSPGGVGIPAFFTWIILFVNFVPISLVVTMGLVRAVQAWHMGVDQDMYDRKTKTFAVVRSSDLNEELGQVSYVMTDKTGTLTANVMEFRRMAIGANSYGDGLTQMRRKLMLKAGLQLPPEPYVDPSAPRTPHVNCESADLRRDLAGHKGPESQKEILLFLLNLAVNHSILIDVSNNSGSHPDSDLSQIRYIASSPDEEALVYGARHFGMAFVNRQNNDAIVRFNGVNHYIEILAYFEFTSERKRSTMICKVPMHTLMPTESPVTGPRFFVLVKGADSVILPRCEPESLGHCMDHLRIYAEDCLRTLCLAYREVSADQVEAWYQDYKAATLLVENKEIEMLRSIEQLECFLTFQGVTGIEDRLATDVGSTIQSFLKAGIKVWMLTGDRFETAMNIGLATELVPQKCQHILLLRERLWEEEDPLVVKETKIFGKLESILASLNVNATDDDDRASVEASVMTASKTNPDKRSPRQLDVVSFWDGEVIRVCLTHDELRKMAYDICQRCKSVVFFRVAPQEKGDVVRMVKEYEPQAVTLAVGDGANDCNMIATAHVGVGIKGKEGMQAFSASDYGLAEFRFLKILLLVHGRWNYRRIAKMVLHTLYKNFVFVMPTFYLACLSNFTGQKVFTESFSQTYNVFLTQLPVIAFGIWDQDVDRNLSLKFPQIYRTGINNFHFKVSSMCEWLFFGLWHSLAVFWLPYAALTGRRVTSVIDQVPNDFWLVSNAISLQVMIVVNSKIMLETMCPNWINLISVLVSFGAFIFILYAQSMWPQVFPHTTGVIIRMISQPVIWIMSLVCPAIALSFDVVAQVWSRSFRPELHHLMQFLMRFEQEEQRAKKALMMEAIRQGGPQLVSAIGGQSGTGDGPPKTRKSRRGFLGNFGRNSNVGRLSDTSSQGAEDEEMEEFLVEEGGAGVDEVADEIDVALAVHERRAHMNQAGISNVVLELLHIKPLFETMKGGFAFTAPDTSAVPLAFNERSTTMQPGMVPTRTLSAQRITSALYQTESALPTPSQSRVWGDTDKRATFH
eukprot:Blabericola_migrator_1__12220@NODE_75_length_15195_cov_183_882866_g67_i0_p1_GENE_NODE_75_length_15195_cov_183_882866_g67_i0NODE_75_length_15195_cov_183_882866_g67_i0_p1_ORF_typecomplete_len1527_score324_89PhoLip_ATPase_C/PF16212_5/6_2e03PhoLip_ATPase_C/PF16212_5/2_1e03PhoLip_ATPase_C/PF16212_5/2_8e65Hydrolase/PF00702_26/8_3e03Hydrolase/PF00702_26/1_2e17Hydrolase/PF00702_26/2_2e05E1E2_ATPase/PF00122_20/2_8e25E1E2_ATPase/PF00122_20/1_8e04PhoLip_ATPase_N/PF16209_5/1_1e22Cation_ATPase/PF13246_6/1_5e